MLPADLDGYQGEVHLQALVLAPGRAAIVTCFVSTWREAPAGPAGAQPSFPPFGGSGLTDDRGRSYRLGFEAGAGGWQEPGVLDISPVPPGGTRWLDLPTGSGPVIRISLAGAGPAARVSRQRITPLSVGERLLAAVAETMLGGGPLAGVEATLLAASLADVVAALEAVRALPPGSRVAARLAALCQRRAIEVRGPLAGQGQTVRLPTPWASVLGDSQRWDGWPGVAPAAAVLPELDGARFVLAGLSSWERQASLQMFAWGCAVAAAQARAAVLLVGPGQRGPLARGPAQSAQYGGRDVPAGADATAGPGGNRPAHHGHRPVQPGQRHRAAGLDAAAGLTVALVARPGRCAGVGGGWRWA